MKITDDIVQDAKLIQKEMHRLMESVLTAFKWRRVKRRSDQLNAEFSGALYCKLAELTQRIESLEDLTRVLEHEIHTLEGKLNDL